MRIEIEQVRRNLDAQMTVAVFKALTEDISKIIDLISGKKESQPELAQAQIVDLRKNGAELLEAMSVEFFGTQEHAMILVSEHCHKIISSRDALIQKFREVR